MNIRVVESSLIPSSGCHSLLPSVCPMARDWKRTAMKFESVRTNRRESEFSYAASYRTQRAIKKAENRRSGKRDWQTMHAALSLEEEEADLYHVHWFKRFLRWVLGLFLLPVCWVTTWTFFSQFSKAAVEEGFWHASEFWYFAIGCLVMMGWLLSHLGEKFFLYLYVWGHEMTHAICVWLCRGKVTAFHVSVDGGYITTNKTNWMIALSPYFVPFWSVVVAIVFGLIRCFVDLRVEWDLVLYGLMGLTWTFHMIWTLRMLPRDQPDLQENGTFLSLVVIYLANLIVLVVLMCAAKDSPWGQSKSYFREWMHHSIFCVCEAWRMASSLYAMLR